MKTPNGVEYTVSYGEPWRTGTGYEQQDPGDYACAADGSITICDEQVPDAVIMERIVLCINYCAGLSNEELLSGRKG